jgi:hypothetical protein
MALRDEALPFLFKLAYLLGRNCMPVIFMIALADAMNRSAMAASP